MPLSAVATEPVTDVMHGVAVVDPYRWLEDRDAPATVEWIARQQRHHDAWFASLPSLEPLRARVRTFLDVDIIEQPVRIGHRYFYRRRKQGQEQACLCARDAGGEECVLIDPAPNGSLAAVAIQGVSNDGRLLSYTVRHGGERTEEIHFFDVEQKQILEDYLPSGYSRGLIFALDNLGFYYCHESTLSKHSLARHEVRSHHFGNRSGNDETIFSAPRTSRSRLILLSDKVRLGAAYLYDIGTDLKMDFHVAARTEPHVWRPVFADRPFPYGPFLRNGQMYVQSFRGAPNGQIVELHPDGTEGKTIVPASNVPIRNTCLIDDRIYVVYMADLNTVVRCWTLTGEFVGTLPTPADGSFDLLPTYCQNCSGPFFSYESFTQPPSILEYDAVTQQYRSWADRSAVASAPRYDIQRTSCPSKDGTQIPISIVTLDEGNAKTTRPTILTSYGGFGMPMTPRFSVLVATMLELGAAFALPNIRGGAEFGASWHEAARKRNRQVAFDDFLASAEWLTANNIAYPQHLAIFGVCNSGLLVAAAMTQRPDLFSAVLCISPLLDMVRYEQFGDARKWKEEYGTVEDEDDFQALYAYSPYHRVLDEVNYPATLFVCGDKDMQCDASHVRKMAARLQDRAAQTNPVLVDYSWDRGHSPVLPLSMRVEALTRRIAFLCTQLGIALPMELLHDSPYL